MTFETRRAYSEVYTVLQYMPIEYVEKIPQKILKLFETERLENYEVKINKANPIDKNYLSKKSMALIAVLNYKYWCPNKKVKEDLYKQYKSNNEKYKKEIEQKYNIDNIFKDRQVSSTPVVESMQMVEYKKPTWYKKIFEKILSIFKKIKHF